MCTVIIIFSQVYTGYRKKEINDYINIYYLKQIKTLDRDVFVMVFLTNCVTLIYQENRNAISNSSKNSRKFPPHTSSAPTLCPWNGPSPAPSLLHSGHLFTCNSSVQACHNQPLPRMTPTPPKTKNTTPTKKKNPPSKVQKWNIMLNQTTWRRAM